MSRFKIYLNIKSFRIKNLILLVIMTIYNLEIKNINLVLAGINLNFNL